MAIEAGGRENLRLGGGSAARRWSWARRRRPRPWKEPPPEFRGRVLHAGPLMGAASGGAAQEGSAAPKSGRNPTLIRAHWAWVLRRRGHFLLTLPRGAFRSGPATASNDAFKARNAKGPAGYAEPFSSLRREWHRSLPETATVARGLESLFRGSPKHSMRQASKPGANAPHIAWFRPLHRRDGRGWRLFARQSGEAAQHDQPGQCAPGRFVPGWPAA